MASPTLTMPGTQQSRSKASGSRRVPWPTSWRRRGLLRLGFAAPLVLLAIRAYSRGFADSGNDLLEKQSKLVHWGSSNLSFVGHVYPPLPIGVAALLPNAMALGIVGALAGGAMLEVIGSRLVANGYPLWAVVVLVVTFGASPSFALIATSNLASFMALTFLALALDGFIRFAFRGQTHGGFQAGIAIGMAGLCDSTAIICALGFAVAAPLIARHRYREERAAGRATAAVLLFPTIAGIAGWTFLCWRFSGSPFGWLHETAPELWFRHGSGEQLTQALSGVGRPLLFTPIFVVAVVALAAKRQFLPAVGICLPGICIVVALWIGLPFPRVSVAVVLGIVGLIALPRRPSRQLLAVILTIAVLGLYAKWSVPPSATVTTWEHALRLG